MKKKVLIIIGAIVACVVLALILFGFGDISGINRNIIGETDITKKSYGFPVISLLRFNVDKITVDAGYYRYGDVNLDGVVDEDDIKEIELIIDSKLYYSPEQKRIADVDESGTVDEADITLFKEYFRENGAVKYNLNADTLEYCMSKTKSSKNCKWVSSNTFTITEKIDYYFFVRQKNTLVESEANLFEKEGFKEKDKLKS